VGPMLSTHMGHSEYSNRYSGYCGSSHRGVLNAHMWYYQYSHRNTLSTHSGVLWVTHRGFVLTQIRFSEYSHWVLSSYLTTVWYPMRRRDVPGMHPSRGS
jgi:hypothetical protein